MVIILPVAVFVGNL